MRSTVLFLACSAFVGLPMTAAGQPILSVELSIAPSVPSATMGQLAVRLGVGEIDGFAVISEPSHTLLGVVLNNESNSSVSEIEKSEWFLNDVAPFFFPGIPPRRSPTRVSAPLRRGATVVFQHPLRVPNDDRLVFSMVGDLLESWKGSRVVRATLFSNQSARGFEQSFALLANVQAGPSPLNPGDQYYCGCGSQPPPCGGGSGNCGCCQLCIEKREGPWCACGLSTTTECGDCGKSTCYCSGFPAVC